MDLSLRRQPVETTANPDNRMDYAVTLAGHLTFAGVADCVSVELCYVPDKLVLAPRSFATYLECMSGMDWTSLEQLATAVMSDITNEVVGRWVQVKLTLREKGLDTLSRHCVLLEDRQPGWENASLLASLKKD